MFLQLNWVREIGPWEGGKELPFFVLTGASVLAIRGQKGP